jgi:hypothetical protein
MHIHFVFVSNLDWHWRISFLSYESSHIDQKVGGITLIKLRILDKDMWMAKKAILRMKKTDHDYFSFNAQSFLYISSFSFRPLNISK